jgi:hypothetical protein
MKRKNSSSTNNPKNLNIEKLFQVLEILGIYDCKGSFYHKKDSPLTVEHLKNLLSLIYPEKSDENEPFTRSIKNAKTIIKEFSKDLQLTKDKGLTLKNHPKSNLQKNQNSIYQTFLILLLGIGKFYNTINLEIINQLLNLENPLGLIAFLSIAIKQKILIKFAYQSGRKKEITLQDHILPLCLNFRDGHWVVICLDEKKKIVIQYLLHSISELNSEIENNDLQFSKSKFKFDINEYYKDSFGLSVFVDAKPIVVKLKVDSDIVKSVQKRRKEGSWETSDDHSIWTVSTYSEDEIFDYIFRWNGKIQILSPESTINKFKEKLKLFL